MYVYLLYVYKYIYVYINGHADVTKVTISMHSIDLYSSECPMYVHT